MVHKKLKNGDPVEVEVWDSEKGKSFWIPATFNHIVSAIDRPYRVSILLNSGVVINECAPECVRVPKQLAA